MIEGIMGGVLIGVSCSLLLLFNGKLAGISGIFANVRKDSTQWRLFFVIGLILTGMSYYFYLPGKFQIISSAKLLDYCFAGLLVGFGSRLGCGCTSGHGVIGMSRLSKRSIVATLTFILSGAISVLIFKAVRGGL